MPSPRLGFPTVFQWETGRRVRPAYWSMRWCWRGPACGAGGQARLVVTFDKSLWDYVGDHIRPEMEKRVEPDEFIPEAMPTSFVARLVCEAV